MKKKYIIVQEYYLSDLEIKVSHKMIEGYVPQGGISVNGGFFFQAMVLKEEKE